MKILNVLDISIPTTIGYTTRARYIVNNLKKHSFNPTVISSLRQPNDPNCRSNGFELPEGSYDGIPYFRSVHFTHQKRRCKLKLPFFSELLEVLLFAKNIDILTKRIKPDIIHAHSPVLVGYAAYKAAKMNSLPIVYEVRAFWEDAAVDQGKMAQGSFRYRVIKYLESRLLTKVDAITVICEGIKNDIINRGIPAEKIFVVKNGVDTERFIPLKKDIDLIDKLSLKGKTVVGFIGTLFNFEGLDLLVKGMSQFKDHENVICLIIGYGQSEKRIINLINEYNLTKKVIFLGKIPHKVIESYYSIIDIFVYPRISLRITELVTPLKPLEAMAMGKPVIASDVGGLKELINDGVDGILFKSGDHNELVQKIRYLIQNKDFSQKLGKKARQNMMTDRNWEKTTEIYKKAYSYARSK